MFAAERVDEAWDAVAAHRHDAHASIASGGWPNVVLLGFDLAAEH